MNIENMRMTIRAFWISLECDPADPLIILFDSIDPIFGDEQNSKHIF